MTEVLFIHPPYFSILAEVDDPMLVIDPDGLISMANPAFRELIGHPLNTINGMRWDRVINSLSGNMQDEGKAPRSEPPEGEMTVPFYHGETISLLSATVARVKNPEFQGWSIITLKEAGVPETEGTPDGAYKKLLYAIHLIMVLNPDGKIAFVNQFCASFFGYTQAELLGSDPGDLFIRDEEAQKVFDTLLSEARILKTKIIWREFACCKRGGEERWTSWVATMIESSGQVLCVGYNRTGGKRAEEALAASEERFRIAAECAGDFVYEIEIRSGAVHWFGPIDEYLGFEPGEIPRSIAGWRSLVHPDDLPSVMEVFGRHYADGEPFETRYRVRDKNGAIHWWEDRGRLLFDRDGRPERFIGVNVDITLQMQADEATRWHLRYLSFTNRINAITSGVETFEVIIPAVISEVADEINAPEGAVILHHGSEEEVRIWSRGISDSDLRSLLHTMEEDESGTICTRFDAGNAGEGKLITHKTCGSFSDNDREIAELASNQLGVFIEHSHLREELALAYDDLSLFVDILVHDINNSTMVAMGYSEIIKECGDTVTKGYATRVFDCLIKNAEIISDVNTLRNLREQKGNLTEVRLDPIIRREIRHHEGTEIHYEGTTAVVLADDLISEIFTNLIGNAEKHGGSGVAIFITVEENDDTVTVRIADTGTGIPDQIKRKVLDRHWRGESKAKGSGLGLFIVRKLMDRYRGEIQIEDRITGHSEEGASMVITFRHPSN